MAEYRYPEGSVLYRNLHKSFPLIESGRGCDLYDINGKKYLDGSGGAAVVNIGHGVKEIAAALSRQAGKAAYLSGVQFTHEPVEKLAAAVASFLPFRNGKVFFLTSGSEAMEASIKLARQYWVERGKPEKYRVISLRPSYHGNTLAALSLSARQHYQETFRPLLLKSARIPAPYCYRCPWDLAPSDCGVECAHELEKAIERIGRERVSAFIGEVIGGSSTGASVPPKDYWRTIRRICDRNKVLLIADEVMTGAGRTGKWLACGHYDLVPDMVVMGKGLTSGYFPLSAVAAKAALLEPIFERGKNFLHAQTFTHHPVGCAAGLATIEYLKDHDLIARCARVGKSLKPKLEGLLNHPHVGDVRGEGLLIGVEFVKNKRKKTPFPREKRYVEAFVAEAFDRGLVLWPNIGQADGTNGDLVMVAPPFIIQEDEISEMLERIESTLAAMERKFG
ncbi:MAG: aspartate aminotransferase family protein [Candidatus Aminicenantes bacterium]|nr:aspartate aminotransferase family protein [Candidatus Aminicenantes bacterium]